MSTATPPRIPRKQSLDDRELRLWYYKPGSWRYGLYRGETWKKSRAMMMDKYSFKIWDKNESADTNHQPKTTYLFNRCHVASSQLRSFAFRLTDIDTKEFVILAADSETEYNALLQDMEAGGAIVDGISMRTDVSMSSVKQLSDSEDEGDDDGNSKSIFSQFFSAAGHTPSSFDEVSMKALQNIRVPGLREIQKAIDDKERECERQHDDLKKEWKSKTHTVYEERNKDIMEQINELKGRMEREISKGLEHINFLEAEVEKLTVILAQQKKDFLFPHTNLLFASYEEGVYITYEDFYCELVKGLVTIDVVPSRRFPCIKLLIGGSAGDGESAGGLFAKVKFYGMKIKGEKGSGIPPLKKLISAKFALKIKVSIIAQYDVAAEKWEISSNNFDVSILEFRGPLGIGRSIMSYLLGLAIPEMKNGVLSSLPVELGKFISNLPVPFAFRGDFCVSGVNLKEMKTPGSPHFKTLCNFSQKQFDSYFLMQKYGMGRSKFLCSMSDFCIYFNNLKRNKVLYDDVMTLWSSACNLFCEYVTRSKIVPDFPSFQFSQCLGGLATLQRKYLDIHFDLKDIQGEFSWNQVICLTHTIGLKSAIQRMNDPNNQSRLKQAKLRAEINQINKDFATNVAMFKSITKNLDEVSLNFNFEVSTGPLGEIKASLLNTEAKMPLSLSSMMSYSRFGVESISSDLPFLVITRPLQCGDFVTEWESTKDYKTILPHESEKSRVSIFSIVDRYNSGDFSEIFNISRETILEQIKWEVDDKLNTYHDVGSNKIGCIYLKQPEIRAFVDADVSLKKSSDLFLFKMVAVPPAEKDDGLLPPEFEAYEKKVANDVKFMKIASSLSPDQELQKAVDSYGKSNEPVSLAEVAGCHSLYSTSPNVKMALKVPEASVTVNILSWMRLQSEFFNDIKSYSHYLFQAGYGSYTEEDLISYQIFFNQFSKYFLNEVLKIDFNFEFKVYKKDKEIFVKLGTQKFGKATSVDALDENYFLRFDFKFCYHDLLDDLKRFEDCKALLALKVQSKT